MILEAGDRHEIQDFVNDEWGSFTQLAWKDMRTTSGNWRVAHDFPKTHDIKNLFASDGSQFTTSAACNPTLTIVTLAIRQADYIGGAMQRGEI